MIPEKRCRLEDIGFELTAKHPRCVPWETRFKQLLEFVVHNGHAHVPIGWKKNVQLSNWVSAQRQDYKAMQKGRAPARLNPDRINMLNSIGFVWDAQRGGRKRSEKDGRVPLPRSHETTKDLSSVHQMQAKKLLQVFDGGANSQSSLSDGDRDCSTLSVTENTAQESRLEREPSSQRQQLAFIGQLTQSEEERHNPREARSKDSGTLSNEVQAIGDHRLLLHRLIQTGTAPEVSLLNAGNIAAQLEFARQILDHSVPNVTAQSQVQTNPWQVLSVENSYPFLNLSGLTIPVETIAPFQLASFSQSGLRINQSLDPLQVLSSMMSPVSSPITNPNSLPGTALASNSSVPQSRDPFSATHLLGFSESSSGLESSTDTRRLADSLGSGQCEMEKKMPAKKKRK